MLTLRRAATALTLMLVAGLSACGDSDPEPSGTSSSTAASSSPSESASASESPTDEESLAVSAEAAAGYSQAVLAMGKKFSAFGKDFQRAVAAKDDQEVLASARRLRGAVFDFDKQVRALDLSAVQEDVNHLLTVDRKIIAELDEVQQARSGPAAVQMLSGIDFEAFTQAFSDLGAAITDGQ